MSDQPASDSKKPPASSSENDALGMEADWGSDNNDSSSDGDNSKMEIMMPEDSDDEEDDTFEFHDSVESGNLEKLKQIEKQHMESKGFLARLETLKATPDSEKLIELSTARHREDLYIRPDGDGCYPIHIALFSRQYECFKHLLEAEPTKFNIRCNGIPISHVILGIGSVAAHVSFAEKALDLLLAQEQATLTECDDLQRSVLHLTAEFHLAGCLKMMMKSRHAEQLGESLYLKFDTERRTFLHAACKARNVAVVKIALSLDPEIRGKLLQKVDNFGMTAIHVAAEFDFVEGINLLLKVDKNLSSVKDARGRTALDWAERFGCASALEALGKKVDAANSNKDKKKTLLISHETCSKHYTCPPRETRRRTMGDVPPENVNRLKVLLDHNLGILRSTRLGDNLKWAQATKAEIADVLRVHDYAYVTKLRNFTNQLGEEEIGELDGDTSISGLSFEAALFAAGSVCDGIDAIMRGDARNVFCAVRPPGHHAGPRGVVTSKLDPNGSYGFCLLSNAAVGAAYARNVYRHQGIKKVCIVDFDVHHGNGTEACVKNLVPKTVRSSYETQFGANLQFQTTTYKPWLNEEDTENVLFASIHGYGKRMPGYNPDPTEPPHIGFFYPSDGANYGFGEFGVPGSGEPKIIDVGQNSRSRMQWRSNWRKHVLPMINTFKPDLIIISAGFDAHKRDDINMGYISALEQDYYWLTRQLVAIANLHGNGRVVSVLEGGYKIQGGIVSPFARSVCAHVAALMESTTTETYDPEDAAWEEAHEVMLLQKAREIFEKASERQGVNSSSSSSSSNNSSNESNSSSNSGSDNEMVVDDDGGPSRKRSRRAASSVDYVALNKKLNEELEKKQKQ